MVNKYRVVMKDYIDYLYHLRKSIFKILPLYEEGNEYLIEYIDDTIQEVIYVKEILEELPHGAWYVQTLASLRILKDEVLVIDNKKKVRKKSLGTGTIILKHINQVKLNERKG